MKKRKVENLMKQAKNIKAPENIWKKIENENINIKPDFNKTKNKNRYPVMVGLAACVVIALMVIMIDQTGINNKMEFTEELITENGEINSQIIINEEQKTTLQKSNKNSIQSTKTEDKENQIYSVNIPCFMVLNHNFYKGVDKQIFDSQIDTAYTQEVDENEMSIYSIKGKSIEDCFAFKANGGYYYYQCIYKGIFNFNNKNYGLEDQRKYINPEKGRYLGEIDGIKIYEFVGNENAILVDMAPIEDFGDSESLYVATLIE